MSPLSKDAPAPKSGAMGLLRGLAAPSPTLYALAGLLAVCIVMSLASTTFLSTDNVANILRQVSINALIAVGMTYVILTGGIDLSVGAVMALAGTVTAGLLSGGQPGIVAVPAGRGPWPDPTAGPEPTLGSVPSPSRAGTTAGCARGKS